MAKIARGVRGLALDYDLRYIAQTDSTNRLARDLAPREWRHGTVIFTDYQNDGRGRKGRAWEAPPCSSLLFSLLFDLQPHIAPGDVIMAAALAVADTSSAVVGSPAALKWPNDVLLHGNKVSGILAEYGEQDRRRRAILGIGLNVNFDPAPAGIHDATGLSAIAGRTLVREEVAVDMLHALDWRYGQLVENADSVFAEWTDRLETLGRAVVVVEANERWSGDAVGVQRSGGLVVQLPDGSTRTVLAADVSIRRPPSFTST